MTASLRQGAQSLVTLTEETPEHADGDTPVVFGNHVRQEAARRSGVLSGVGNTHGLAELPGQLSPDDIRLWEAACLVDCEPSTSELVTILKVFIIVSDQAYNTSVPLCMSALLRSVT